MATNLSRERIEEGLKILKGWRVTHFQKGKRNESEEAILAWFLENGEELCQLALRATDPDMVLVSEKRLVDLTAGLPEHPDDWDYPCFCDECKEYGI